MVLRVQQGDKLSDILMVVTASEIARTPLFISIDAENENLNALKMLFADKIKTQSEEVFVQEMDKYERVRTCSEKLSVKIYQKAAELGKYIATQTPLAEGRLELLHYVKEQSVTFEYHRYGSINEVPEI
ncbi:MAG: hypothetical protein BWZ00_01132 [Bacteroidetes bacterium ADurb.BinA174]|nr:MAG: hypothetical protein BWZ00_01132 [Bacteroidetes bacterium ADurb.BinA174]